MGTRWNRLAEKNKKNIEKKNTQKRKKFSFFTTLKISVYCMGMFSNVLCCTLKKSYKRPPYIVFLLVQKVKIRSITIHNHMNKTMSNSGSVIFCIPNCVILFTQTKHE